MKTKEPKLIKIVQEMNEKNQEIKQEKGINLDAEEYLKVILTKLEREKCT